LDHEARSGESAPGEVSPSSARRKSPDAIDRVVLALAAIAVMAQQFETKTSKVWSLPASAGVRVLALVATLQAWTDRSECDGAKMGGRGRNSRLRSTSIAKAAKEIGMKLNLWRTMCLVCVFCVVTVIGLPEPTYRSGQNEKVMESLIFDETITIVGSEAFVNHVRKALSLLQSKSSSGYPVVKKYIGRIKEGTTSGMYAYYNPPTFQMSAKEALLNEINEDYALQWCATVIVHDAYHSKKYHDYQEVHGHSPGSHHYPPIYIWTGEAVERECLAFQRKVCREIGAYQTICEYLKKCDGRYCQVARNW
jgi:hypothetical protein